MTDILGSLRFMQQMERLATNMYKQQVPAFKGSETASILRKAQENEKEHIEILTKDITRQNGNPSWIGLLFGFAGGTAGLLTRFAGKKFLLKADTWIERMAVRDYTRFLEKVNFDTDSKALLARIIEDEKRHIKNWSDSINALKKSSG